MLQLTQIVKIIVALVLKFGAQPVETMLAAMAYRLAARAAASGALRTALSAGPSSVAPLARLYHQNIVDHYENPRNVGACPAVAGSITQQHAQCSMGGHIQQMGRIRELLRVQAR